MKIIPAIGVQIPKILLPKPGVDLARWAVIACDQFTSEPEYWQAVADLVGDAPSTYHMILPEVYLETPAEAERVLSIRQTMQDYLQRDLFVEYEGFILVERSAAGKTRHGIMLALDLEQYDYSKGATSLIRASEGTILERIPPRVRIRSGAALELPHILVLIDDPGRTVIDPLVAKRRYLRRLYDFDLMLGSGHLSGYSVDDPGLARQVRAALAELAEPAAFAARYSLPNDSPVMLFAMGDGNHSLATAKAIWEELKPQVGMDHPARFALVEIENIHDEGLEFEPVLRVLFDVHEDVGGALYAFYGGRVRLVSCADAAEMTAMVDGQSGKAHAFGIVTPQGCQVAYIADPPSSLPVGTLQNFLDAWGQRGGYARIDYVHGVDVTVRLGSQPGNVGFYLPAIAKRDFFKTVIVDGALPRKTFSMGEAKEKRFYMEARRIV
ncbi:MAG: DUF1015 domain-containing protein [Chloroflexi bacterium HGW-Chloroflexi-1]|nr:MAG: DUF1015 domain-containing protein [Chloroflexi bacterium HGW-Chloroflexi-1]